MQQQVAAPARQTIWSRSFIALFGMHIMVQFGFNLANPNIAPYAKSLGAAGSMLGLVVSLASLASFVSRPVIGLAADKLDRRRMMLVTQGGLVAVFCLYGCCKSMPLLLFARVLHGVLSGLNATLGMTLVVDLLPAAHMASGVGIYSLAALLSLAIAPGAGLALIGRFGFGAVFFGVAALDALTLLLFALTFDPAALPPRPALGAAQKAGGGAYATLTRLLSFHALPSALMMLLNSAAIQGTESFLVLFGQARGIAGITLYFTFHSLVMLVARPMLGRLSDRLPVASIAAPCCLLITAGMLVLAFAQNLWWIAVCSLLVGVGFSGVGPLLQVYAFRLAPSGRRGAVSATCSMGQDIGYFIGPLIVSTLIEAAGYTAAYVTVALLPACGVLVLLATRKTTEGWLREREAEAKGEGKA